MSQSLSFECERAPQPADDPLEKATWASLRIYAGQRCVTRWFDRDSGSELDAIYIPVFHVAEWLVRNWWFLLHEACPMEHPPRPSSPWTVKTREWIYRHCLRSAESGLFLPRLILWNDGQRVCVQWDADPGEEYGQMPGLFLYGSFVETTVQIAEDAFRAIVQAVIRWTEASDDLRAVELRKNWQAIVNSTAEEAAFARAAARLGLDPYATETWPDGLVDLVESELSGLNPDLLVGDFVAAIEPEHAVSMWGWINGVLADGKLSATPTVAPVARSSGYAGQAGVLTARDLRNKLGIGDEPIEDVTQTARLSGLSAIGFQDHNHRPNSAIRAAVGFRDNKAWIVGPLAQSPTAEHFLKARGLYHALFTTHRGPRLITRGHDWDQQASRGFAAELLAPRRALIRALEGVDEGEEAERSAVVQNLSHRYGVNVGLIERQLQNAARNGY